MQFGAGTKWTSKSVTGTGTCSNGFFGTDPAPNVVKSCQLAAAAPTFAGIVPGTLTGTTTLAASTSLMPAIDMTQLPAPAPGFSVDRVMAANVADPTRTRFRADIGDFREVCDVSHMSYDDPIVSPGVAGAHLHTFFGNTGVNSKSTSTSIATTGNSTCAGGTLNRSGYWVPTMIDTKNGAPVVPATSLVYYKQGYDGVTSQSINLPGGLADGRWQFDLDRTAGSQPVHLRRVAERRLDLQHPELPRRHTDHLRGPVPAVLGRRQPRLARHKVAHGLCQQRLPERPPGAVAEGQLEIHYNVTDSAQTARWRLASDNYSASQPAGYSGHGDWFYGWNNDIMKTVVASCLNKTVDCHAYLIGDGRMLF